MTISVHRRLEAFFGLPETSITNGSKQKGVQLREASFLHRREETHSEQFMLAGINLKLGPGDFVGVMGTVGSGKSSLLQVITILALRLPLVNLNQQEVRQICGDPGVESATLLKRRGCRF